MLGQILYVISAQYCSGCLQVSCGHTGRGHIENLKPDVLARLEHKLNTGNACNVGNLMRISHHGCGTMGKHSPSKFSWYKQSAFQMKMAINKAWGKYLAIEFDNLLGLTLPKTDNQAIEYGNGG
jgi:hypothetical protein